MPRRTFRWLPGLVVIVGAFACSLVVDTSEVNRGCGPGKKFCRGACVGNDDPAYGCAREGCEPCTEDQFGIEFDDRHVPKCEDGACALGACAFGWGCAGCSRRLLTDPANCGRCNNDCRGLTCSGGECKDWAAGGETSN